MVRLYAIALHDGARQLRPFLRSNGSAPNAVGIVDNLVAPMSTRMS